ncbi:MAG: DUF354 domain-containing protein [Candidatus Methanoperedens sp.]|nr:DUF354 domain-containing protein [Candidatus Methanoperedens sp.]
MKILIDIGHPAHVHFFKNIIWNLEKNNHQVLVTTMDKEVSIGLLRSYKIDHQVVGKKCNSKLGLILEWIKRDYKILMIARKFNPDILMGISNPCIAHSSWILRKYSIIFDDTEHASFAHKITYPFADVICTPSSFKDDVGIKQIKYDGCHELAYLHPNYFTPNPAVLEEMGLSRDDNIFMIRFAAFNASHDLHSENFKKEYVPSLIKKLEKHGKIIISSEKKLDGYLEKYRYNLSPDKYHDVLYYSKLYIGEGSTSAEEAAILGTPSLHFERLNVNGKKSCVTPFIGILDELQSNYGLLYSYCNEDELLDKVDVILSDIKSLKRKWAEKRDRLLREKINVTDFIVRLVENYPESFDELKENPKKQQNSCKILEVM